MEDNSEKGGGGCVCATSKLRLSQVDHMTNVFTNFQNNYSKTVIGFCDRKLLVFCTQIDTRSDRQTG